jgi:FKBP-type peptidyl-prolyl cis-trans isomerase 2
LLQLRREHMSKNIKTLPTKDFEDVVATVSKYVEGLRVGSIEGLIKAFHNDAVMYGFNNKLLGGSIKNLYDFVEKNGTAPEIKTRIDVLAITPTTAVVRIDMEKDAIGANYTDFHTLIKIDGTWQIIAKVFHMYEG